MPIKNPMLDGVGVRVAPPVVTDYTSVLQGAAQVAETVLTNRKDNILQGFRNEVSDIQDQAIATEERTLSAADQTFTSDFARRMDRINRIATQGVGAGARSRALLEAETALRRAQRLRPALATELRQEAALVLGADPTGTQLELMSQASRASADAAEKDWAEHVKHGYELGIDRTITPGSELWYKQYEQYEANYASNIRIKNGLELIGNIENATERTRAEAQFWLANPEGVFRATVTPLNEAMKVFASTSPSARLAWMGGQGTLNIGGKDVTFAQLKSTLEAGITELDSSFGGLNEETRAALATPVSGLKTRIQQTLEYMSDSKLDPAIIASQFEMETNSFLADLPESGRRTIFLTTKLAPFITALNGDDFARNNLVKKNELLEQLFSIGGFEGLTGNQIAPTFDSMITSQAGKIAGTSREQTAQLAYQDYLTGISDLNEVLANSKVPIPPEVATSYATKWVGAVQWLKNQPNLAPELVEQWLENFQNPQTLAVLQKADPNIGETYARELVDFFNENSSPMTEVYDEIRSFRNLPRYRGDRTLPASDILTSELRPDGQVVLQFAPDSALTPEQKTPYMAKMRTWGDALTRRVRAQATLDQLIDNTTDTPDYQRAYLKMSTLFPFTVK